MIAEKKFSVVKLLVKTSATLGICFSGTLYAAGAVSIQAWDSGNNIVGLGETITVSNAVGNGSAFTDNPGLNNSSWAHTGAWWNFQVSETANTTLRIQSQTGSDFWPGASLWASGANEFDGGTTGFGGEVSSAAFGTPHSFNSTGVLGSSGTLWMANGFGGNMLETLAYGVSNNVNYLPGGDPGNPLTGWGEEIQQGFHDVSVSNIFESGISGSTGDTFVEFVLNGLQSGWYTLYVGGTNHSSNGGLFDISVSATAVPVPAAVYLFGSALIGLLGFRKKIGATQ